MGENIEKHIIVLLPNLKQWKTVHASVLMMMMMMMMMIRQSTRIHITITREIGKLNTHNLKDDR